MTADDSIDAAPPASVTKWLGRELPGGWRVDAVIGEGGMAAVYAAQHIDSGGRCAVKVVRTAGVSDDAAFALSRRLEREAKNLAGLRHPNTVRSFGCGTTGDGDFYLLMEEIRGRTLADVIERDAPLPAKRVVGIARQVLASLTEAHALGVFHRDLKPANIMLTAVAGTTDFVKVLDFGISRSLDEALTQMTRDGMIIGTPRYMAPEGLVDSKTEAPSDLYALGLVVYELLSGRYPYPLPDAPNLVNYVHAHGFTPPCDLRGAHAEVTDAIWSVVTRLLAKLPEQRYATAPEAAAAFEEALAASVSVGAAAVGGVTDRVPDGAAPGEEPPSEEPPRAVAPPPADVGSSLANLDAPYGVDDRDEESADAAWQPARSATWRRSAVGFAVVGGLVVVGGWFAAKGGVISGPADTADSGGASTVVGDVGQGVDAEGQGGVGGADSEGAEALKGGVTGGAKRRPYTWLRPRKPIRHPHTSS